MIFIFLKKLKYILVLLKNALFNKEKARELILNRTYLKFYIFKHKLITNDYLHPQETDFNVSLENANQNNPAPLLILERNINFLKKNNFFDDTFSFIDIGSGCGILIHYVLNNLDYFCNYYGIEFEKNFFEISKKNLISYKHKNMNLHYKDARNFLLEEKKYLIYLYNPFKFDILKIFLSNNYENIIKNKSTIIYHNDIHIEDIKKEFKFRYLRKFSGTTFILPKN